MNEAWKTPWKLIDVSQYIFGEHLNWIKKDWEKAHLLLSSRRRLELNNYDKSSSINGKSSEKENRQLNVVGAEGKMINPLNNEIIIEDLKHLWKLILCH